MGSRVRQAAASYIQAGLAVIPVLTGSKSPGRDGWQNLCISEEEVPQYWTDGQGIGLLTGEPSGGVVDIDLDVPEALAIAGRFLQPTRTSGRENAPHSHWWYVSPSVGTATFKDYSDGLRGEVLVELRADGRQTLVWPSIHPDGDRYVWHDESGLEMAKVEAATLEGAVKELATATLIARHIPPVGGRHDFALALAGFMLRDDRFDPGRTLKILKAAWHAANAHSRDAMRDLEGIVEDTADKLAKGEPVKGGVTLNEIVEGLPKNISKFWGWDYEAWEESVGLPSGLPSVDEFDSAMLPPAFRGWITDIAERMQVPMDFLAAGAMVVASAVIGRKMGIHPKRHDDWLVVPNLWGAIIGRPALLKSPALAEVMKPLDRLVIAAYESYKKELKDYEIEVMLSEAKQAAFKEGLKKRARKAAETGDQSELTEWVETEGRIEAPKEPVVRRYKTEDTTVEKLCELLMENSNGLLIHRDELAGWLRSLEKQGREGDRAFYLESWNGTGSVSIDRIGRGSLHIPALCLSVLGGIQPGPLCSYVYQATRGEQGDDGLLQRFQLLVWPDPSTTWRNVDRYPDTEAKNRAYEVFGKLDKLTFEATESSDEDDGIQVLRFTSEAQGVFDTWRAELERRLRSEQMSPALESHLAKYRSLMPSFALILELIDSVEPPVAVGKTAALQAAAWCEYLETRARRLYSSAENPEIASARALLERIRKGDVKHGASVREIYQREYAKLATPAEVNAAISTLSDYGRLRVSKVETGGRSSTRINLILPCERRRDGGESLVLEQNPFVGFVGLWNQEFRKNGGTAHG